MKFKDGAAVEVCRREGDVFGSWFRARVVSSNGCAYTVQYDHFLNGDRHPVTEEVHLKAIRPIPPTQIVKNWASGDTVEVHDCHSWKVAELMKVLPSNFFVVRLLNSDQQRTCHLSNLRSQQSWQSSKWVLTRQAVRNQNAADGKPCMDTLQRMSSLGMFPEESLAGVQLKEANVKRDTENEEAVQIGTTCHQQPEPFKVSVRLGSGKRKVPALWESDLDGLHLGRDSAPLKKRKVQNLCRGQTTVAASVLPERVGSISFPRKQLGEECVYQSSPKGRRHGSLEVKQEEKVKVHAPQTLMSFVEATEAESSQCSVSSSSSNMSNVMLHSDKRVPIQAVACSPFDDAHSSCECANERRNGFASEAEVSQRVHELELYAYRSALRAFYASGPLSWDQEVLLTNLRLSLHVSNDEHLHELRCLCSPQVV